MTGPIFTEEQADAIREKYGIPKSPRPTWDPQGGFPRLATDAEMGRPDRRLALTEPACECCGRTGVPLEHSAYEPYSTSVLDESSPLLCEGCLEGAAEWEAEGRQR